MNDEELKNLILQFAASCTLAEHLGDVVDDLAELLQRIGFNQKWSDLDELHNILAIMKVKTLYNTNLEIIEEVEK